MKQTLIIGLCIALCVAGLYGGVQVAGHLSASQTKHDACKTTGQNHEVKFGDTQVQPTEITARRCDTMTISSVSSKDRLIAFGVHNQHTAYNGVTEQQLQVGESFTITLATTGTFIFHDHKEEALGATFTVAK